MNTTTQELYEYIANYIPKGWKETIQAVAYIPRWSKEELDAIKLNKYPINMPRYIIEAIQSFFRVN